MDRTLIEAARSRDEVDTETRVVSIFHFRARRQVERWFYPDDPVAWNLIFRNGDRRGAPAR